jgi:hypothetical protein
MKYARSCTCSNVGGWTISFGVFAFDLALDPDLAFETESALEADFALLVFRGFLVSVAGAAGADGIDGIVGAVNVSAIGAATETDSVAFVFLRTARF